MKTKSFAIIGIGRFGEALINQLYRYQQVIGAFDLNEEPVKKVRHLVNQSGIVDCMNPLSLKELSIENYDYVIVSTSSDREASMIITANLKELGVKNIIVKSSDIVVSKIINFLGATQIINPEKESGERLAHKLMHSNNVEDVIPLNDNISIVYIKVLTTKYEKESLLTLEFRKKYNVNIVAIKRDEEVKIPEANDSIIKDDILIVVGNEQDISRFEQNLQ